MARVSGDAGTLISGIVDDTPEAKPDGKRAAINVTPEGYVKVDVKSGTINVGTLAATVSVALDGTGGTPDTVGIVDAAGDRAEVMSTVPAGTENALLVRVVSQPAGGAGLTNAELRATPVPVSGPLTNTELRATAVPVSGTFFQGTQPVSAASLPLPAGASTLAAQLPNSHDVTVDNAAGAAAINVQDGGNSLTVDGVFFQATQPVSGTFFQATQPVSAASLPLPAGASTEATLSALSAKLPASLGPKTASASLSVVSATDTGAVFKGRAGTFRTLGRAGTAGQNIMAIHNASGSAINLKVTRAQVDMWQTVAKAVTVAPPIVRLWKVTVLPTNGTALAKSKVGGTGASSASVTVFGDASADGTGSATTLTTTRPAGTFIAQQTAPRFITAAGYEMADSMNLLSAGDEITLAALEGLVIFVDYTLATQNPITDMWVAWLEWLEF